MEVLPLRWAANGLSEIGSSFCHVTLLVSGNEEEARGARRSLSTVMKCTEQLVRTQFFAAWMTLE